MNVPYCITACIWHDWAMWDKLSLAKPFCYSAKANVQEWNRVHNYHDKGEQGRNKLGNWELLCAWQKKKESPHKYNT